jgi:FkbM family methyltransferase
MEQRRSLNVEDFIYREGTLDKFAIQEVIVRNVYLKEFLVPFMREDGIVIDAGAQIGSFTVLAARTLNAKVIISVEPEIGNYEYLLKNIHSARIQGITRPFNLALWDGEGELPMFLTPENSGGHSLIADKSTIEGMRSVKTEPVKLVTLDGLLETLGLGQAHIKVIKIDAEGAEIQILKGGSEALQRTSVVVGEMHESVVDTIDFKHLLHDFVMVLGEPLGPLKYRTFWAVNKRFMTSNPGEIQRFLSEAPVHDLRDFVWRLRNEIDWRDKAIADKDKAIADRDKILIGGDRVPSILPTSLDDRDQMLTKMPHGIATHMLRRYQSIIEFVLTPESRRRKFYEFGLTGVRVILNEGWSSFFHKTWSWIGRQNNNKSTRILKQSVTSLDHIKCFVCGSFYKLPNPASVTNFRESVLCKSCGALRRQEDLAQALVKVLGLDGDCLYQNKETIGKLHTYLLESYGPIFDVLAHSPNLTYSEFWEDVPVGQKKNGILCQDVRGLTFESNRFDLVISQDIFEHISDPEKGFREIFRVLKHGGYHIFTVPYSKTLPKSRTRAIETDRKTNYLLPATYHGDKLRPNGILVYTDFGFDIINNLTNIGFLVETHEADRPEYANGYNIVFVCKKMP